MIYLSPVGGMGIAMSTITQVHTRLAAHIGVQRLAGRVAVNGRLILAKVYSN
jgi:hypothetical protein